MSRRPSWIPPRKAIPRGLRERILDRAAGLCEGCGERLSEMNQPEIDHIKPQALGGTNDEENLQVLGRHCCHVAKSAEDARIIAQADRKSGRSGQWARRKRRGGSMIPKRGFDKRFRRKMDGTVEPR